MENDMKAQYTEKWEITSEKFEKIYRDNGKKCNRLWIERKLTKYTCHTKVFRYQQKIFLTHTSNSLTRNYTDWVYHPIPHVLIWKIPKNPYARGKNWLYLWWAQTRWIPQKMVTHLELDVENISYCFHLLALSPSRNDSWFGQMSNLRRKYIRNWWSWTTYEHRTTYW